MNGGNPFSFRGCEDRHPPAPLPRPEQIGRGGMGDIYRATDSVLGRVVAIKILADSYAHDESVRERFTREALSAARLSESRIPSRSTTSASTTTALTSSWSTSAADRSTMCSEAAAHSLRNASSRGSRSGRAHLTRRIVNASSIVTSSLRT